MSKRPGQHIPRLAYELQLVSLHMPAWGPTTNSPGEWREEIISILVGCLFHSFMHSQFSQLIGSNCGQCITLLTLCTVPTHWVFRQAEAV